VQARLRAVGAGAYHLDMAADLLDAPIASAEFLAVDVETNGLAGERCELTEVGAVLVGGGELHDTYSALVEVRRPLGRAVQRLTGITQSMVDREGLPPAQVLAELDARLRGRVLVAHNAAFDRRVLRQAYERAGMEWPGPPVICTIAMARRLAPLAERRGLPALAGSLGIDVTDHHRALPDAQTCARIFCALFGRLCANVATIGEALELLRPPRRSRRRPRAGAPVEVERVERHGAANASLDFSGLPNEPGIYVFRDVNGRALYVGKSVTVRARARSHFAPGADRAAWTGLAATVDHETTRSELGALLLEARMIRRLRPPGNDRLTRPRDGLVYIVCRFDVEYPILEVAPQPAPGRAVTIGPLRGRAAAVELVEQLTSLFELRHCGRRLHRRTHPSAYGQMGRCLSPCLGDLDPNAYRRRLDQALALFSGGREQGAALLDHVDAAMRAAAAEQRYERAAWLRRRRQRLQTLLRRISGLIEATHARPRLVLARHPERDEHDGFWLVAGRVVDWGPVDPDGSELERRTRAALAKAPPAAASAYLPAEEIPEQRIVLGWLAANPDAPVLALDASIGARELEAFVGRPPVPLAA
jgi:DNA polymerase-3 subunit epsilon